MQQGQDDRRLERCSVRMLCPIEVCDRPVKCVWLGDDLLQRPVRGRVKDHSAGCIISGISDLCQTSPFIAVLEPDSTSFDPGCSHGAFDETLPNLVEIQGTCAGLDHVQ